MDIITIVMIALIGVALMLVPVIINIWKQDDKEEKEKDK